MAYYTSHASHNGGEQGERQMIYSIEDSAAIMTAINSILLANNGYSDIGNNPVVIEAVKAAGFTVIKGTSIFGGRTHKAFTFEGKKAQIAEQAEIIKNKKPLKLTPDFDYEGAILARQERLIADF
jgi:hypothetical protein